MEKSKPDSDSSRIKLNREEGLVYQAVDGHNSVADLIEQIMLSEFEICRALYDLSNRNLVVPVERQAKPAKGTVSKAAKGPSVDIGAYVGKVVPIALAAWLVALYGLGLSKLNPLNLIAGGEIRHPAFEELRSGVAATRITRVAEYLSDAAEAA